MKSQVVKLIAIDSDGALVVLLSRRVNAPVGTHYSLPGIGVEGLVLAFEGQRLRLGRKGCSATGLLMPGVCLRLELDVEDVELPSAHGEIYGRPARVTSPPMHVLSFVAAELEKLLALGEAWTVRDIAGAMLVFASGTCCRATACDEGIAVYASELELDNAMKRFDPIEVVAVLRPQSEPNTRHAAFLRGDQ
jgi:hypothetical protein